MADGREKCRLDACRFLGFVQSLVQATVALAKLVGGKLERLLRLMDARHVGGIAPHDAMSENRAEGPRKIGLREHNCLIMKHMACCEAALHNVRKAARGNIGKSFETVSESSEQGDHRRIGIQQTHMPIQFDHR